MTSQETVVLLLRLVLSLAIVLALAVVLIRFGLPRLSGWRTGKETRIEILGLRPLDRQHKVALLRAEGRKYLVLFGGGAATTLDALVDTAAQAEGDAE